MFYRVRDLSSNYMMCYVPSLKTIKNRTESSGSTRRALLLRRRFLEAAIACRVVMILSAKYLLLRRLGLIMLLIYEASRTSATKPMINSYECSYRRMLPICFGCYF